MKEKEKLFNSNKKSLFNFIIYIKVQTVVMGTIDVKSSKLSYYLHASVQIKMNYEV